MVMKIIFIHFLVNAIKKKKISKFFISGGSALSSQASSQALHFETNLTG